MWYPVGILHLYFKVISDDILHNDVKISDVRLGVQQMATAYLPHPNSLQSTERRTPDFNVRAHRCAYLHKHGAFHTALVYHMMTRAIQNPYVYRLLATYQNVLRICSLGGGPGNDLIGVLSALHHHFGFFRCTATIVDMMSGWEDTFHSILHELRSGDYGTLGQSMQPEYFDCSFVTADLLGEINRDAREAIQRADIITMIKFVSATACLDTASMIEEGRESFWIQKTEMWYPIGILYLYLKVISDEILHNDVKISDVRLGVRQMATAYKPCPKSLQSTKRRTADFNVRAHRCAYLHKNGAFHTALVYHMMTRAIQNPYVYRKLATYQNVLRICSLGGGPGNDLIGVLSALHHHFGFFRCTATIVDMMSGWEDTFHSILHELRSGDYGTLGQSMQPEYFDCSFVTADLLGEINRDAREAIQRADIITMIKFVSATACLDTASMIEEIFRFMKPNALLFFIDNASGGFRELVIDAAIKYELNTVFGPLKFEKYKDEAFKTNQFGYESCYKTTVTVQILAKSHVACISEALVATAHHPSSMSYENSPGYISVRINDQLFVRNGHTPLTDVNPIQSKKKRRKLKIPKQSGGTSSLLGFQRQAVAQISSNALINPDLETKSNGIENKNIEIYSQTFINSNIPTQQSVSETDRIILRGKRRTQEIKEKPLNPLEHPVLQGRRTNCIININEWLRSRPASQPSGLLAGNHQVVVPQHTSVAKKQVTEPNSVGHTLSETTKGEYKGAGFTNITQNPKSVQCSGEKPQKILKELINNESSSQNLKHPMNSATFGATKRKDIMEPPIKTSSLQFNGSNGNAESIDKWKYPNGKEKESCKAIRLPSVHPDIQQMDNRIVSIVPDYNVPKLSLSKRREDDSEPLKSVRSNCTNVPHRTIPPQSAHNVRPANQPCGLLAGNHQVVPLHTRVAKKQVTEPNSVGNTFPKTTKGEYKGAGFTNITPNPKSVQCSGEKPQKILSELINNESSSQNLKHPKNSATLGATKRKDIVKPPTQTRSLQFNGSYENAENIDNWKFPNGKEKESCKPIRVPNGHPNIQQMDNRIVSNVPDCNEHKPFLSKRKEDDSEPLKSVRSSCTNVPHRSIPPQSAHNATGFIQRNSSSIVNYQSIPPPSDIESSDDSSCSCCAIS